MVVGLNWPMAGLPTCHADSLIAAIRAKPPSFFHGAVRHLMLTSPENLTEILPVCTSVESLWLLDLSEPLIQLVEPTPSNASTPPAGLSCGFYPHSSRLLQSAPHLCVLVCLNSNAPRWEWRGYASQLGRTCIRGHCPRAFHQDWYMGTHGGSDYWSRAEIFIAKRRSGEIDPLKYRIPKDEIMNTV
ncbi:hypothetical protein B0H13DRAFT_2063518 [Mycena leptocephala]|nr:hypothetical protein B0H13DRAFT_2063518 [Mycena leptocephala]